MAESPLEELERLWAELCKAGRDHTSHGTYLKAYAAFERSLHAHAEWLISQAREAETLRQQIDAARQQP